MVNPLGIKYTKHQMDLPGAINHCLSESSAPRIITITLAIIKYLVEDINNSQYCQYLFENVIITLHASKQFHSSCALFQLPVQYIVDLCKVKDSSISKTSKIIITNLGKAFELYRKDLSVNILLSGPSRPKQKGSVQKITQKESAQEVKPKDSSKKIGKSAKKMTCKESSSKVKQKPSARKTKQKSGAQKTTRKGSAQKTKSKDSIACVKQQDSRENTGKKRSRCSSKCNSQQKTPSKDTLCESGSKTSVKRNISWPFMSQCPLCQQMLQSPTKSYSCTADFKSSASTKAPSTCMQDTSISTAGKAAMKYDVRTTMPADSKFALKSFRTKVTLSSISAPINLKLRKEVHINDSDKLNALHAQESCTNINEVFSKCPALATYKTKSNDKKSKEKSTKLSVTTIFKMPTNRDLSGDASENATSVANSEQNNGVSTTILYTMHK